MKRINLRGLVAVALLALPVVALGDNNRDSRDRVWERSGIESYRHSHPSQITTGHIEGFRIIIRDNDVTGIRYSDRREHGAIFVGDRHRYSRYPHRVYNHDSWHRLGDRWSRHKKFSKDHFKRERHSRQIGWSTGRGRHLRD